MFAVSQPLQRCGLGFIFPLLFFTPVSIPLAPLGYDGAHVNPDTIDSCNRVTAKGNARVRVGRSEALASQ